jgi:hypothetical protein
MISTTCSNRERASRLLGCRLRDADGAAARTLAVARPGRARRLVSDGAWAVEGRILSFASKGGNQMQARIHRPSATDRQRAFHTGASRRISRTDHQLDELRRGFAAIFQPFRPTGGSPA